jgi:two-component system response regulator VicR
MTRVLVVEDDPALARVLSDTLASEGYETKATSDGNAAIGVAAAFAPDLVLLDIGLPGKSGFELCRLWREGPRLPIIMLTARSLKNDKLRGLEVGADDYVTKPFDLDELIACVRAVLRRARPTVTHLKLGRVLIDFETREAWRGDQPLELSHREMALLHYMAERPDSIVHRDELLKEVWGYPEMPHTRSVDHAIARLRRKIEPDPHHPQFIHTAYAGGYLMTPRSGSETGRAGVTEPADADGR